MNKNKEFLYFELRKVHREGIIYFISSFVFKISVFFFSAVLFALRHQPLSIVCLSKAQRSGKGMILFEL